ncbi:MAG: prepilin-type N-terminal cleavage/methylation domain-containing protein [Deltaproteobacteria bacterium]|nr:prepilin-type N-terminal cleavage/methylation domain-containing protein [Deltaproteobacteria bacterium]
MRRSGFSLIEVIIVIAIISILASMAVPYAAKIIDKSREETTRKEMEEISSVILGDTKIQTGGFVGDVGRLPAGIDQLNVRTAPPLPAPPQGGGGGGFLGVKIGWYGPYVNTGFDPQGYLNDAWGTAYAYGNPGAGQIRSAGPDRAMGNADDIIYPSGSVNIYGRLLVNLYVWDNTAGQYLPNPQPGAFPQMTASIAFYYSNNGNQATASIVLPPAAGPPYSFNGYHAGLHAVAGTCRLSLAGPVTSGQAVVYVPSNNQQAQLNLYLR